jgi:hypothetical protein
MKNNELIKNLIWFETPESNLAFEIECKILKKSNAFKISKINIYEKTKEFTLKNEFCCRIYTVAPELLTWEDIYEIYSDWYDIYNELEEDDE